MPPLVKIRSARDQMSAIERRIADFILDNSHLLRDYSSQQLANALGISQSSVVKFSQKFGFKGYPDLKYSIGEALARGNGDEEDGIDHGVEEPADDYLRLADSLRRSKDEADEETRLINPRGDIERAVATLSGANKVFVCGLGEDGLYGREFALKLSLLGILTVHHADSLLMMASLASVQADDVLLVFTEYGKLPELSQIGRQFQACGGKVVSITRHTANPVRANADIALLVSAHHPQPHIEQLVYRSALQQLLDFVFALLCMSNGERQRQLDINMERMQRMIHS